MTLRWKIRLAIGNRLFLMTYLPSPANKTGCRDLRSAENTLNRILSELGLERKAKPVLDLKVYLKERYGAAE